ncbi:MAG: hypothetical protein ACE5EQ_11735 [Phycisphaerae bacterium]
MRIEYDPTLIEQTVFLACRRDRRLESELHAVIDPLYAAPSGREDEKKFHDAYAAFFSRLQLDASLLLLLAERPLIDRHVGRCIVREAARRKHESAEMFLRQAEQDATPADRTLIIQLCPLSFLDSGCIEYWMRRDLLHVSDMLDDRFSYRREVMNGLPAQQNLLRDRYRVLWDIYVQGRLTLEGRAEESYTRRLRSMFDKVFNESAAESYTAFDRVFRETGLTHARLIDWAAQPNTLFHDPYADPPETTQRNPGGRCPLCGFPTYDWFRFEDNGADPIEDVIHSSFPDWNRQNGACRQCAEIYSNIKNRGRKTTIA